MNNPDFYQDSNNLQRRDITEYLEKQAPTMKWKKNHNRVLDIGCADGGVTKILQTFLPDDSKLLGCDISEDMVKFATYRYTNEQTSFIVLDIAGDMPLDMKGNFDQVFSFFTLHWVTGQKRALQNIFDLLDQDGECSILVVGYSPVFDVYRAFAKDKWSTWVYDVEKYISPYHDSKEPDKELTKLMVDTGFVDVNVECMDKYFLFGNEDMTRNFASAICPFKIPKDKYDDFLNDYLQIMSDIEINHKVRTNHSSTDVTLHYTLISIYGRKPFNSELL